MLCGILIDQIFYISKKRKSLLYGFPDVGEKILRYAVHLHLSSPGNLSVVKACNSEDATICISFFPGSSRLSPNK